MTSFFAHGEMSSTLLGVDKKKIVTDLDKNFTNRNQERLHRGKNEIILTFDDGPTPNVTNKILDTLKEKNIKATFFVIAQKAKEHPALMDRILNEGHIVANHSFSHRALKDLGFFSWKKTLTKEIFEAHSIIAPYMANAKHFYYRAPEGAWDSKYADFINREEIGREYIGPILWDIGGEIEVVNGQYLQAADWACWSKKISIPDCLSGYMYEAKKLKGGVVLMHDLKIQSAEMLNGLISSLENEGFIFKTMDDIDWK